MDVGIRENVRGISKDEEDKVKEHTKQPKVKMKEAEKAIELLRTFLESQENVTQDGFMVISGLKQVTGSKKIRCQKSLKDYFCC